ncbi:MAG: UDP-N-acetylmuramoyl-L-alanine--D-glutamate ligase, partial [Gammaproteobacteria bacterium]|nr:UDP-N-acetylmuramoyl-L-alanine--D-glutamate ligase [Gammaproteobacteria bacterium]
PDFYVLELSSFQLERTTSLRARAAVVLNISPDHMDRHASLEVYAAAKASVYRHCEVAVINRDEPAVPHGAASISFGLDAPEAGQYGIRGDARGVLHLTRGDDRLLPVGALALVGTHNVANALAALALTEAAGFAPQSVLPALASFRGLPHRCEPVATIGSVEYVDDSKGTNVGATVAAVRGFAQSLVLIAGGDGKGADFAPLADALGGRARAAVLIGRDAGRLAAALSGICRTVRAKDMQEAVREASRIARAGDVVLLSPACASQDMFEDYRARGAAFAAAVRDLEPGR